MRHRDVPESGVKSLPVLGQRGVVGLMMFFVLNGVAAFGLVAA